MVQLQFSTLVVAQDKVIIKIMPELDQVVQVAVVIIQVQLEELNQLLKVALIKEVVQLHLMVHLLQQVVKE